VTRPHAQTYALPAAWDGLVGLWVLHLSASGKSAATIRLRRGQVRGVARRVGALSPAAVTVADLEADLGRRGISNDYRRSLRSALVGFYGWALERGEVASNPAKDLPKVSESTPRPRPATDAVWVALLVAAPAREELMARLACEAGLRRAEVAQAHGDDLIVGVDGSSLIVHGKGGKQRVVPIGQALADAITAHGATGWLFPRTDRWGNVYDEPLTAGRVGVLIAALMPPGWSMHKLRHRYATRGYAGTQNIRAVQEALGHASVATTQRYTAVSSREVRAVADAAAW